MGDGDGDGDGVFMQCREEMDGEYERELHTFSKQLATELNAVVCECIIETTHHHLHHHHSLCHNHHHHHHHRRFHLLQSDLLEERRVLTSASHENARALKQLRQEILDVKNSSLHVKLEKQRLERSIKRLKTRIRDAKRAKQCLQEIKIMADTVKNAPASSSQVCICHEI